MIPPFFLLFSACTDPGSGGEFDLAAELSSPGPYSVGYRESEITYPDTVAGGDRSLRLATWYPTEEEDGDEARYWMGSVEAPGIWQDAAPAAGPSPLLVFSHGHQGYAENSSFLMEHLASHGFVVAAPDHTGNTLLDGGDRATEIYLQRPLDISAVLDAMEGGDLPLTGEVVAAGHSFGGYTLNALAEGVYDEALIDLCLSGGDASSYCSSMTEALADRLRQGFSEPRILGFIPMAAGDYALFGDPGLASARGPLFLMIGELDEADGGDGEEMWAAIQGGENLRLDISGGGHQSFTDYSGILETGDELIEPEEGFRIINAYTLAFARRLLGDDSAEPLLTGQLTISERDILSF